MPSRVSPEARFFAIAARCQPAVEIAQDPRRLAIVSPIELELALGSIYEAMAPYERDANTGSFVVRRSGDSVPPRTATTLNNLSAARDRLEDELLRRRTPHGSA